MKVSLDCYLFNHNVDIVTYDIPKKDSFYLSDEEKTNCLYEEQLTVFFDRKTHEVVESGSGINLIYNDESFDGFGLNTVRREYGERINEMVELCKAVLMERLSKIDALDKPNRRQELENAIRELREMIPEKERALEEAKTEYEDCVETLTRYEAELDTEEDIER